MRTCHSYCSVYYLVFIICSKCFLIISVPVILVLNETLIDPSPKLDTYNLDISSSTWLRVIYLRWIPQGKDRGLCCLVFFIFYLPVAEIGARGFSKWDNVI